METLIKPEWSGLKKLVFFNAAIPHVKTIGGLSVQYDNAYYESGNKAVGIYATDSRFFITVAFDTGSSASKSYTMPQYKKTQYGLSVDAYCRWFDDLDSVSNDYWGITTSGSGTSRTFRSAGRYIVACVLKEEADNFYIYDNTNERYVCKGKNVT